MVKESQKENIVAGNFIKNIIEADIRDGVYEGKVRTRFPPEPNGYLHIGHAKSICLNFGVAKNYPGGTCNLRFDDTNPEKESVEYMESIKADVKWLGFDWEDRLWHASDYFEDLYNCAVQLIKLGKAYVCSLTAEEIRAYRGTLTEPGRESPYRQRSIEENLNLFAKMKNGDFEDGSHVLRAKIDMASGNINMRDPTIYRIRRATHHRTGNKWCLYPMYDFAHCLSDYFEKITHSLCTLEFQDHRPLYDWILEQLTPAPHPKQIEFARLNLNYTVTSKRKLKALVDERHVIGWDDPRMPTLTGLRRRGFTPASIRQFCERIGVAKKETTIDMSLLEESLREDLNVHAKRVMCVLNPLKLIIENYPEDKEELLEVPNHPQNPSYGHRKLPFSKEIYIEQEDFAENPPPKYFRLAPGQEVRLRYAYIIRCREVIKDSRGHIQEIRCTFDPETLGKMPQGRKVKGIIHWVSARHSLPAKAHLYDRLFHVSDPTSAEKDGQKFTDFINPDSLHTLAHCQVEPSLAYAQLGESFQFERLGYFCIDKESSKNHLIFNRSVTLRDTWAKLLSQ